MKISIFLKSFIIIIAFSCLNTSCGWGKKKSAAKGKNIICVVDFSDSKNAMERLQFYSNVIKDNIIPTLGVHDKITVEPIDNASITNASDILLKDLSVMNFEPEQASPIEEEQITKDSLKKYITLLQKEFLNNFQTAITNRNKSNHGTDIFGALEVVKGKLKSNDDNYIILLSDMMNWSDALNMETDSKEFNSGSLEKALKKVPNFEMPKTTVLVLTAEQVEVSSEHFKLVQLFWKKYFEKNKINLYDYNSASLAKLNELMALPVNE